MFSLNSVDSPRTGPNQEGSSEDLNSLGNGFPPFLNVSDKPNETKLNKLFKAAKLGTSIDPLHKNPEKRKKINMLTEVFDSVASENSFRVGSECSMDEINSVLDPACGEEGVIELLERIKIKIGALGTLEKKFKGVAHLALIKSKLQMRRKSDASKWGGGVSRLESRTSFLVYDYIPAIAIQDAPSKKELSSPLFPRERTSSRHGSTERKMSRIEETLVPCTTMTLISPAFSMKTFNVKDAEVFSLEREDEKGRYENIRQLIKSSLSGNDSISTLKIMIVKKDNLKEIPEANLRNHMNTIFINSKSSYFHDNIDSRTDLNNRKISEHHAFKGNTIVELKVPNKERIKLKIHSVVTFKHSIIHTDVDSPFPQIERVSTLERNFKGLLPLSPLTPQPNLQQVSQTSIFSPKNADSGNEGKLEFPKPTPPQNPSTLGFAKAKLANILNPTENNTTLEKEKEKNSNNKSSSLLSPKNFISPRVTKHQHTKSLLASFEKQKPSKFKDEKPTPAFISKVQSQRNSPRNATSKKMNQSELFIQETYNQTKLKLKTSVSSPKPSKKVLIPSSSTKNRSIDKKMQQTLPNIYKRSADLYKPSKKLVTS